MFTKSKDKQERAVKQKSNKQMHDLIKQMQKYKRKNRDPIAELHEVYGKLGESNINILKSYWDDMESNTPDGQDFGFMDGVSVEFSAETNSFFIYVGGEKGKIATIDEIDTKLGGNVIHSLLIGDTPQANSQVEAQAVETEDSQTVATVDSQAEEPRRLGINQIHLVIFHVHMYIASLAVEQLNKELQNEEFRKAIEGEYEKQQEELKQKREELNKKKKELAQKKVEFLNNYQELRLYFFDEEYKFKVLGKDILLINKTKILLTQSLVALIMVNLLGSSNLQLFIMFMVLILLIHSFKLTLRIFSILKSYL